MRERGQNASKRLHTSRSAIGRTVPTIEIPANEDSSDSTGAAVTGTRPPRARPRSTGLKSKRRRAPGRALRQLWNYRERVGDAIEWRPICRSINRPVTVSVGGATTASNGQGAHGELSRRADQALYRAKSPGATGSSPRRLRPAVPYFQGALIGTDPMRDAESFKSARSLFGLCADLGHSTDRITFVEQLIGP